MAQFPQNRPSGNCYDCQGDGYIDYKLKTGKKFLWIFNEYHVLRKTCTKCKGKGKFNSSVDYLLGCQPSPPPPKVR